ncbi:class II fructose-bisphosphate aldolase [Aerococcus loyolae]|uniref:Class II fructose-bisphosphate aldolase n=1 Tax=Aerococcus loyolae TaxID=2976809 RepID=A0ABT4C016_9LACT|nr:class II fructose-bisphosphate aldolase [Aerococcus loyolae]MCY3024908.1 class II fructose-bisphosphate aldolase [Aerococcus loyolae]MCY3027037.1 class II fructose-bisphosphate aldolase [Aerococcus loyolae]MCY3028620.1 class II fructose-bisphosphate aldolase [Aerococcus loyolae]OAM70572.1 fructose-bisphosphate aldolase [Aerococcus loyolae]
MTLVSLNKILEQANEEKYAVGAFNATNINTLRGIVEAAEENKSPVVIQLAESHFKYFPLNRTTMDVFLNIAEDSSVPVCVHLDHGETFEAIVKALAGGFSSVMVDASKETFEENVRRTKKVIELADILGVTVEAELGVMNAEDGSGKLDYNHMNNSYTNPNDAKKFVELTHVDALAVAFGTVHGVYASKPHLNFERLREIKEATKIPLVVHGGSGLSDEEYRKCVENGINKINYYSTMSYEVTNSIRNFLNENKKAFLFDIDETTVQAVKQNISAKIKVFGSAGKV